MGETPQTHRIPLSRGIVFGRILRDSAIGLAMLGIGLLLIAPGLVADQDLGSFDLFWRWLFFAGIFVVGAVDALRILRLRRCAFEIGPNGMIDYRIQHRAVPWNRLERADWLVLDGAATVLCLWPAGPIERYRKVAPLWGYFGLIEWLRKTARRTGYEFGPLNVDLASLEGDPERIRAAVRHYWGDPTARPLMPDRQLDRP